MKKHWTLRYIIDRIFNFFYFYTNKNIPWLSKKANKFLNEKLNSKMSGVEFGSGNSTIWIAKRVKFLTSIEHNSKWFEIVSQKGLPKNLKYLHIKENDYSKYVSDIQDSSIDFCLNDGLERDIISANIISKIKPGGFILIDDVERYLPKKDTTSPSKGCCKTKLWEEFDLKTKNWERKYFSDGITDQIFLFKPKTND